MLLGELAGTMRDRSGQGLSKSVDYMPKDTRPDLDAAKVSIYRQYQYNPKGIMRRLSFS